VLIKSCFECEFHLIKKEENEERSHCQKENCWSRFSKCVLKKALDQFLANERSKIPIYSLSSKSPSDSMNEVPITGRHNPVY